MMLGAARGQTNEWTREQCGVYTMRSLLQQRRLCLCRSILKLIGNLQQAESVLPALLFGRGMQPGMAQLTDEGSPTMSCNPWVRLWYADMEEAVRNGVLEDMPVNMMAWTDTPGYLSCRFKKVYSFRDSGEDAESAGPIGLRDGPRATMPTVHPAVPGRCCSGPAFDDAALEKGTAPAATTDAHMHKLLPMVRMGLRVAQGSGQPHADARQARQVSAEHEVHGGCGTRTQRHEMPEMWTTRRWGQCTAAACARERGKG